MASRQILKLDHLGRELFREAVGGFASNGPQQLAIDPRDESVWYVQPFLGRVVKRSSNGTGLAVVVGFDTPVLVDVDPSDGSVWVAEFGAESGGAVVKLDPSGSQLALRQALARLGK